MDKQENKLGFTAFAENWNGRLAMLGFVMYWKISQVTLFENTCRQFLSMVN